MHRHERAMRRSVAGIAAWRLVSNPFHSPARSERETAVTCVNPPGSVMEVAGVERATVISRIPAGECEGCS